jgi:hypothetical protein
VELERDGRENVFNFAGEELLLTDGRVLLFIFLGFYYNNLIFNSICTDRFVNTPSEGALWACPSQEGNPTFGHFEGRFLLFIFAGFDYNNLIFNNICTDRFVNTPPSEGAIWARPSQKIFAHDMTTPKKQLARTTSHRVKRTKWACLHTIAYNPSSMGALRACLSRTGSPHPSRGREFKSNPFVLYIQTATLESGTHRLGLLPVDF